MAEKKSEPRWEQVSLEVEQGLAEDLVSLLGEILPGGVVLEFHYGDLFPDELEHYQGPAVLSGFFPAEQREEIEKKIASLLEGAGQGALLSQVVYAPVQTKNWATAWQERYRPIPIGERLIVVPTWLENPSPDRLPIWIDPGMAFGSGTHPTTRLCLSLLETSLVDRLPGNMIDVGCGSGILSIAASRLGVKSVLGLDNDPEAVQVAKENAQTNGVGRSGSFLEGSVIDLMDLDEFHWKTDLVVANIIAPILLDLFGEGMGKMVAPGGRIILSGILEGQLPSILACLDRNGFEPPTLNRLEGWVGIISEKAGSN